MFRATGLTGWQRAQMGWPGFGAASPPSVTKEQELSALKQRATDLEQALGELNTRIEELETSAPDAGSSAEQDAR
jgi:predicted  nucleic acid-binding Zn-ribbon protein